MGDDHDSRDERNELSGHVWVGFPIHFHRKIMSIDSCSMQKRYAVPSVPWTTRISVPYQAHHIESRSYIVGIYQLVATALCSAHSLVSMMFDIQGLLRTKDNVPQRTRLQIATSRRLCSPIVRPTELLRSFYGWPNRGVHLHQFQQIGRKCFVYPLV